MKLGVNELKKSDLAGILKKIAGQSGSKGD